VEYQFFNHARGHDVGTIWPAPPADNHNRNTRPPPTFHGLQYTPHAHQLEAAGLITFQVEAGAGRDMPQPARPPTIVRECCLIYSISNLSSVRPTLINSLVLDHLRS
jgi:hypothetical protein